MKLTESLSMSYFWADRKQMIAKKTLGDNRHLFLSNSSAISGMQSEGKTSEIHDRKVLLRSQPNPNLVIITINTLPISIYIYLYLSISIYSYLYLSISIYSYLYLSISIYSYLYLSISIYSYLYLSIYYQTNPANKCLDVSLCIWVY